MPQRSRISPRNLTRNVHAGRLKGYQQALAEYDLPFDPDHLIVNDLSESAAIRTARTVILQMEKLGRMGFL